MELACVTGRFQPFHCQHLELFDYVLDRCDHLLVAITNPDTGGRHEEPTSEHRHTSAANPFTYYERARLLGAVLAERGTASQTTVVPLDLTRPVHWSDYVPLRARHYVRVYSDWERHKADLLRDAGYAVTVLDGDPRRKLSASSVRRMLSEGDTWVEAVPAVTIQVLREFLDDVPMTRREEP